MIAALVLVLAGVSARLPSVKVFDDSVRVEGYADNLFRVEKSMSNGNFYDSTTFSVSSREFQGTNVEIKSQSGSEAVVSCGNMLIHLENSSPTPKKTIPLSQDVYGKDSMYWFTVRGLDEGFFSPNPANCSKICSQDRNCVAFRYTLSDSQCWLLANATGPLVNSSDVVFGGSYTIPATSGVSVTVTTSSGSVLFETEDLAYMDSDLVFPGRGQGETMMGLLDAPRFYAPPWGGAPMPPDAKTNTATNGYDFSVGGFDGYFFYVGGDMEGWAAARQSVVQLTGGPSLLPDSAFGTWFTRWYYYNVSFAESEVDRWESDKLPLDTWALDMDWRSTLDDQDHYYTYPNTTSFPSFKNWFDFLHSRNLTTYFNDHPYPIAEQTAQLEVGFRSSGLWLWLMRGLDYWWNDCNWGFANPPPQCGTDTTGMCRLQRLDNRAWNSHLYYTNTKAFNDAERPGTRTLLLSKGVFRNQRPGIKQHEHVSQHRYG